MEVSAINSASTALQAANTKQEVSMAVLKKAINIGAEGALSLIQAIPNNQSAQNLPAHLGNKINTTA